MSISLTNAHQELLLRSALGATASEAWADDAQAIHILRNGDSRAIVVFQNITSYSAEIHICLTKHPFRASRDMIEGVLLYAGLKRGWTTLTATIPSWNRASLVFALKMGAEIYGIHPVQRPGQPLQRLVLLRLDDLNLRKLSET